MSKNTYRIIVDILLYVSIAIFPWWCGVFIGFSAALLFPLYFEAILAGWCIDTLYGGHIFEISAYIIIIISFFIRKRVQFLNVFQ